MPKRSDGIEPRPAGAATAASDDAGFIPASALDFARDGAAFYPGAAASVLPDLLALANAAPQNRAGTRLQGDPALTRLLADGPIQALTATYLPDAHPVRAILFEKSSLTNWSLGWHQDRTVAVRDRRDVAGYSPWTLKQGILHVSPPFEVIERMVTLRIHLDAVPNDNAPLLIAPGSHRLGLVREEDISTAVGRCGVIACLAKAGDVWAYSTPILHASAASHGQRRRRVLQVDYAAGPLDGGLEWLGI
ncbi:phytanoyl-CoA dioxygenase family protein [Sphingomonas sp.]|uniref:phytanoyl-CoA dioxygenase family protein n=1 Tax=Sphingomonas sp. TaxID=28214 RepID=UPI0035C8793E